MEPEAPAKAKAEAKETAPKSDLEILVASVEVSAKSMSPHNRRQLLVSHLRKYGHDPQSPEYVAFMQLANKLNVKF